MACAFFPPGLVREVRVLMGGGESAVLLEGGSGRGRREFYDTGR